MTWKDIPWRPTPRVLRQFAVCWTAFVGLLAWRVGVNSGQPVAGAVLAVLAAAVGVLGLMRPSAVRPLFLALMVVTLPLNWIVSRLLLAVVFYGVFTPTALVMRLLRRDALELRVSAGRSSYWRPKLLPGDPRRYFRPF